MAGSKVFVSLRSVFHKDRMWVGQPRLALKTHQLAQVTLDNLSLDLVSEWVIFKSRIIFCIKRTTQKHVQPPFCANINAVIIKGVVKNRNLGGKM